MTITHMIAALTPIVVSLLLLMQYLNAGPNTSFCKPVKSWLGSMDEIHQKLSPNPFRNSVCGELRCRTGVVGGPITLPILYCPNNILFPRTTLVQELIDRLCAPVQSLDIVSKAALSDSSGTPAVFHTSNLLHSISLQANRIIFNPAYSVGLSELLASSESPLQLWIPIKVPGLEETIVVFVKPAAIIAWNLNIYHHLTARVIRAAIQASTRTSTVNRGTYFVNELVGHPFRLKVIYVAEVVETENCPICLEEGNEENPIVSQVCGHGYHATCINQWKGLRTSQGCPQCRFPLHH